MDSMGFTFIPQDEVPTHCDVCKKPITEARPIRFMFKETFTIDKKKVLPDFVFCLSCYEDNEKEIENDSFDPRPYLK